MKRIITLLLAGVLISVLAVACDNEGGSEQREPNENEIQLVQASNEVAEFFDYESGNLSLICRSLFDVNLQIVLKDTCVMISSVDEYRQINFRGELPELPVIDFDRYTLVIGQYVAMDSSINLIEQSIVVESEEIIINTWIKKTYDFSHDALEIKNYWGLYPKLSKLPIRVVRYLTPKYEEK